MLNYKFVQSFH